MNKSMFLKIDQELASKELDAYGYCLAIALEKFMQGDFAKSAIYFDNAARSQRELDRLKRRKQEMDEVASLLKQINLEDQRRLYRMEVNIYE